MLVYMGSKRVVYAAVTLMSMVYALVPMPELFWCIKRVFEYIGFCTVGVVVAGESKPNAVVN